MGKNSNLSYLRAMFFSYLSAIYQRIQERCFRINLPVSTNNSQKSTSNDVIYNTCHFQKILYDCIINKKKP